MKKLLGLMLLILFVSKVSLPGLMAFKIIFAIALMGVEIFFSIFGVGEEKSDTVNASDLKF
jgi:hypothetical protein